MSRAAAVAAPDSEVNRTGQRECACRPVMERIQTLEDKADWVKNEIDSRNTDKSIARRAQAVLARICP